MFAVSNKVYIFNKQKKTMLNSPLSPDQLRYFQEVHYRQRIAQTNDPKAKIWLQEQLDSILNINDTSDIDRANRNLSIKFKNNLNKKK